MKVIKIFSQLLLVLILSIIGYSIVQEDNPIEIVKGNLLYKPIPFILEKTDDTICKMLIHSYYGSSQAITKNGDTYFFNDIGCMMIWLEEQPYKESIRLWVYTKDTKRWLNARLAHYTTRDKTVVGYGFGASERELKDSISFEEMRVRMLKEEHLLNPKVRKRLLKNRY
jgi:hypothetical protein